MRPAIRDALDFLALSVAGVTIDNLAWVASAILALKFLDEQLRHLRRGQ